MINLDKQYMDCQMYILLVRFVMLVVECCFEGSAMVSFGRYLEVELVRCVLLSPRL